MIRVQNVYYMLAYAFQVLHEQGYKNVATEEFDNVAELLSAILCRGVSVQIKRGLIRQYISREEALASPRGKLEIGESIKTQVIRKKQLICNYDEFSVDAYPNRIIKTTMDLLFYPYQMYINWQPEEVGNILYNDKKFVTLLYSWNNDYFTEYSKVSDAGSYIKGSIYEFIESSEKTVIVVDCENSDPYKLCATLKNLDHEYTQKIASIILFDDVHTASAWRILDSFTAIHVEHMMIERVKQSKSLVDVMLIARTCQEHYKNNVDSFILVSSDSDYWGLISSLPEARFLVMIERENCGPDLKNALLNAGIFYCYIDDFYSGNAEDIKLGALFKEMERYIDQTVRLNINEMFSAALKATRIEMSSSEKKQFIAKYLKTMQMEITDDGDVVLQLKRK